MGFWAKYGTETTFQFPMIKRDAVDFAKTADWTPASGDAAISKDNGNLADTTNTPAIEGGSPTRGAALWALTLTATELQTAVATVQIIDAATKAVEDQSFKVYTYGNASAFFKGDWSDIVRLGLTALPNAAADAAGGLPISDAGGLDLDAKIGALTFTVANKLDVNTQQFAGQTITCSGGVTIPAATLASTTNITAGTITTVTNLTNAPTAGDLTATMKTSVTTAATAATPVAASVSGNVDGSVGSVASGGITRASFAADTGLQSVRSNTAQSGATGSITLDASASATSQFYMYALVYLTGGTGAGQVRRIIDYNGTTKVAAVQMDWETAPDNTTTFAILPETIAIISSGSFTSQSITTDALADGLLTAAKIATAAITDTKLASNAITAAKIADGAITAGKIATDAIDADALSADAVTAIQSGLATSTELAKVPKSDGTASWNATALAAIQSECNDALVAYDPPTNAEMEARTLVAASYGTAANQTTITTHLTDIKGATWSALTDTLEGIRDRGDAAWATATGFSTLDAAGVRTAVGLASANLDTQLADLPTVAEFEARTLVAANYFDPAADTVANVTTVGSVTTKTGYKLASDGLDLVLVESGISAGAGLTNDTGTQLTSINARQALSVIQSACGAVLAGAATTSITVKPAALPSGNTRITATVDADGNRSAVTLKVPD